MPREVAAPLVRAMRVLIPLTGTLWWLGFDGTSVAWRHVPEIRDGAVVTVLIAAMCWVGAVILRYICDRLDRRARTDDKLITLLCERAESHAQESQTHLREAGGTSPRRH